MLLFSFGTTGGNLTMDWIYDVVKINWQGKVAVVVRPSIYTKMLVRLISDLWEYDVSTVLFRFIFYNAHIYCFFNNGNLSRNYKIKSQCPPLILLRFQNWLKFVTKNKWKQDIVSVFLSYRTHNPRNSDLQPLQNRFWIYKSKKWMWLWKEALLTNCYRFLHPRTGSLRHSKSTVQNLTVNLLFL